MEVTDKEIVASVAVLEASVSEDELAVYEAALSYALDTLNEAEIEQRFGASVDEIEGMRDDLRAATQFLTKEAPTPEPVMNKR